MKLAISLGYSGAQMDLPIKKVLQAEELGYDSVWTAEAYGSDAVTPLAFLAAHTKKIKLATGIMQLAARTPASASRVAMHIAALAGGDRVIAGLGVSGPQIVEGWYGQPWGKPYWRIRDYVTIMKKIFKRQGPVLHEGKEISLPYNGPGAMGIGKPLQSILHPNPNIPIWLGTSTETNIRLTAEIADGWLAMRFVPRMMPYFRPILEEGFKRAGNGKSLRNFDIHSGVSVKITDDVKSEIQKSKAHVALYVGGMGHRDVNFHHDAMARRGFQKEADRIQELFLSGYRDEAVLAVPDEYVEEEALMGSPERIKEGWKAWRDCGVTSLSIGTDQDEALELMANLARE